MFIFKLKPVNDFFFLTKIVAILIADNRLNLIID